MPLHMNNQACCVSLLRAAPVAMATCDACRGWKENMQVETSLQQQPCSREEKCVLYQETCLTFPGFSRHDKVKYSVGIMVGWGSTETSMKKNMCTGIAALYCLLYPEQAQYCKLDFLNNTRFCRNDLSNWKDERSALFCLQEPLV